MNKAARELRGFRAAVAGGVVKGGWCSRNSSPPGGTILLRWKYLSRVQSTVEYSVTYVDTKRAATETIAQAKQSCHP